MITRRIWPLVDAATMRALDRHTIETEGVPGEILMESAGRAVTEAVLELLGETGGEAWIVCGAGNNGGDGLVVARQLEHLGVPVRVHLVADAMRLGGDAGSNLERARRSGVRIEQAAPRPPERGVVVDAVFGTGLSRNVEGAAALAIAAINTAREAAGGGVRVVAVDLPSGLDADTGRVQGCAVRADRTVTISLPKIGLVLEPGRSHAGDVWVARVGIADEAPDARPLAELWSPAAAGAFLPARPADGHKLTISRSAACRW